MPSTPIEQMVTPDDRTECYEVRHHILDRTSTSYHTFDAVMDEIERVVLELIGRGALPGAYLENEIHSVGARRGTVAAYDTLINLREKLREVCSRQGETAMANLSPDLINLEGQTINVRRLDGEECSFTVGRSSGWMPCHLEITPGAGAGRRADREYEAIIDYEEVEVDPRDAPIR